MAAITKEGIEVEVGQVWRDLDKRMGNRQRKVIAIVSGMAHMAHPEIHQLPPTWVSIARMHKHSAGWALVTDSQVVTTRKMQ